MTRVCGRAVLSTATYSNRAIFAPGLGSGLAD